MEKVGTPSNPAFTTKFYIRLAMDPTDPPKLYGDENDKVLVGLTVGGRLFSHLIVLGCSEFIFPATVSLAFQPKFTICHGPSKLRSFW